MILGQTQNQTVIYWDRTRWTTKNICKKPWQIFHTQALNVSLLLKLDRSFFVWWYRILKYINQAKLCYDNCRMLIACLPLTNGESVSCKYRNTKSSELWIFSIDLMNIIGQMFDGKSDFNFSRRTKISWEVVAPLFSLGLPILIAYSPWIRQTQYKLNPYWGCFVTIGQVPTRFEK